MKFDVHLYPTVRIKVEGVEAETYEEAIEKAQAQTNLHQMIDCAAFEYAEEIGYYLVDVEGDEEHAKTKWFHHDQEGNLKEGSA